MNNLIFITPNYLFINYEEYIADNLVTDSYDILKLLFT